MRIALDIATVRGVEAKRREGRAKLGKNKPGKGAMTEGRPKPSP